MGCILLENQGQDLSSETPSQNLSHDKSAKNVCWLYIEFSPQHKLTIWDNKTLYEPGFFFLNLSWNFLRSGDSKASLNLQCIFFEQWDLSGPSWAFRLAKGLNTTKSSTHFVSGQTKVSWKRSMMPRGWQRAYEWISKLAEMTLAEKLIKCPSDNGVDS